MSDIHCGACLQNFDTMSELNLHLELCPVAKILLPYVYMVSLAGIDAIGHPVSHFLHHTHKHAHVIKRYAYAVADGMPSFDRAKIHIELCENLKIDYDEFRPFDSEVFDPAAPEPQFPTRQEAEEILWFALIEYYDLTRLLEEERKRNEAK
jgi:hypothetical protein